MGIFTMPSLGADMEDGILVEWLKAQGDTVARGDIVAVVETEKGAIEIEIFEDGKIDEILVPEGSKVPVGSPLATILGAGETVVSEIAQHTVQVEAEAPAAPEAAPEIITSRPIMDDVSEVRASPAARLFAKDHNIDLNGIRGTGPSGAIQLCDVENAKPAPPKRGIDLDAMRHAIASAMSRSKREIPHYYLTHRIDVSGAQNWLDAHNAARSPPERILFGALLVKAAALAIRDYPEFNGLYEQGSFRTSQEVHAGIAIAIRGGGLVAPAIQNADQLSLAELMVQMRDLIGRVRRGSFRASELTSSTMTVNSLGDRGVEGVLPIIYPPQVAIIGFGKIIEQPWVIEDEIVPRPILQMTLAADHRVSDGHRGGLLLNAIAEKLDAPESL
ncbi:dihydrolipoamide acetyltransferase family protein [Parasphingorhabdus sp.]|uniref:dihydrolipoamide acetyltransferase family protein n=1 Tax=Parasphingorhabdus sp. TaxID=2709688 RepID=UPI0032EE7B9D